jgi:hypothetical protein
MIFQFDPYLTASLTTTFHRLLFVINERFCQELQLCQKKGSGWLWTEDCLSLGVQQASKCNSVGQQYQFKMY